MAKVGGRPSKYPWDDIEHDFKAGVPKPELCRRYRIPTKTLDNKIAEKKWKVSGLAVKAMSDLEQVSGSFGQLEEEDPKTAAALYDRVRTETDFDIRAGRLVIKTMRKLEEIVDEGTKLEKVGVGKGIQRLETVGMMGGDYKDVLDAAYKGKELLKGKDITSQTQVAVQQNSQTTNVIEGYEVKELEG